MASAYVYILRCVDNSLYTGYTSCLNRRLQQHQSGRGAKYTKTRLPVKLVWFRKCASARIARQWEYHIKQLTKKEKELLLQPQQTHHQKLLEKIRQSTDEGLPMPAK